MATMFTQPSVVITFGLGWRFCRFRTQCALCGLWADYVWRHFFTESTSNMSVCASCADALHTSTEQEQA